MGLNRSERPVRSGIWRGFRYHIGSLAFGSFILAVTAFLRMIFEYVSSSAKKSGNDQAKKVSACISCCLACFDRLIKFLNEQAFVRIALTGENFCPACKSAFWD